VPESGHGLFPQSVLRDDLLCSSVKVWGGSEALSQLTAFTCGTSITIPYSQQASSNGTLKGLRRTR
jgi:hypothetical protein